MKKSLVALATLAAATGAFAQSSVTIYGALDAGLYNINRTKANGQSVTNYGDSSLVSSIWGLRGSEDLGGGNSAIFNAESDIQTNNGGLNSNGLFRRAANVGLSSTALGTVELGVKINPIIATNALLMPVSGNSVSTVTSTAFSYNDFFTKDSVTYTSPTVLGGLVAQYQLGMGNVPGNSSAGSVSAWSLNYANGPLAIRAAAQDRKQSGTNASANAAIGCGAGSANAASASQTGLGVSNTACYNKKADVLGASYNFGTITVALASVSSANATSVDGARTTKKATQMGVGYQLNAQTLLGFSRTQGEGSSLTNAQARYDLSKRSTLYVNYGVADNNANGTLKFTPIALNTGAAPSVSLTNEDGTAFAGVAGLKSTAIGAGVIHRF